MLPWVVKYSKQHKTSGGPPPSTTTTTTMTTMTAWWLRQAARGACGLKIIKQRDSHLPVSDWFTWRFESFTHPPLSQCLPWSVKSIGEEDLHPELATYNKHRVIIIRPQYHCTSTWPCELLGNARARFETLIRWWAQGALPLQRLLSAVFRNKYA